MNTKLFIILMILALYAVSTLLLILAETIIAKIRRKKVNKPELASDIGKIGIIAVITIFFVAFM